MIARGPVTIPVWLFAVLLVGAGLLLTAPISFALARAAWPRRSPRPALVLWQAVCLAAGFSVVAGLVLLAVEPLGTSLLGAAATWFADAFTGSLDVPAWRLLCGIAAAALTAVLLTVLARTAVLTLRRRHAHRQVLDLLTRPAVWTDAQRMALSPDVRILDHRAAVAYTLPGWHSRVVLSAGLVELLSPTELAAVVEHERAHLRARHDLLVLPFQAWAAALGRVPGVRSAGGAVSELTEMLADDVAAGRTSPGALASALAKVALSDPTAHRRQDLAVPWPNIAGTAVADRVRRLLDPRPLAVAEVAVVYLAALLLLAIPATTLLLSWT